MAKFLTTSGTMAAVEDLLTNARGRVVLISPFVQIPNRFLDRVREAVRNRVEVLLICRAALQEEERERLLEARVRLSFVERLHAKCYCNENEMIITSLNLYSHSEQNNYEMGVRLSRMDDAEAFAAAEREVNSIIAAAEEYRPSTFSRLIGAFAPQREQKRASRGYCIRCQEDLPYQPDRPLCRDCFKSWAVWENPEYEEKVCHGCGTRHRATMAKPLCRPCYRADASMN
jgi:phosphatidylserine/phosphatidylglycerophosphate/cardiolipin synthase-like enzyme